jgi:hypothetical protein
MRRWIGRVAHLVRNGNTLWSGHTVRDFANVVAIAVADMFDKHLVDAGHENLLQILQLVHLSRAPPLDGLVHREERVRNPTLATIGPNNCTPAALTPLFATSTIHILFTTTLFCTTRKRKKKVKKAVQYLWTTTTLTHRATNQHPLVSQRTLRKSSSC